MNVCTQCGKENIPVIPANDKCPHEYEIELQAADALARAAKALLMEEMKFPPEDMVTPRNNLFGTLSAYEKARGYSKP